MGLAPEESSTCRCIASPKRTSATVPSKSSGRRPVSEVSLVPGIGSLPAASSPSIGVEIRPGGSHAARKLQLDE